MSDNLVWVFIILAFWIVGIRGWKSAPKTDDKSTVHTVTGEDGKDREMGGGGKKFGDVDDEDADSYAPLPLSNVPDYWNSISRYQGGKK